MTIDMLKTTALGTCLSLALVLPAAAQDASADNAASGQSSSETSQSGDTTSTQSGNQARSGQSLAPDTVVAQVGETEILGTDVIEFISALPPRMRQQPPQMLMSMAIDQVILRELLLQEAQSQNLAEDPRVTEIVDRNTEVAREDAMVAVFVQDQLAERVTDDQVQSLYEQLQGQTPEGQSLPPLEQLRPQIEQQLQRQAAQSLRQDLVEGAEIVLYGTGETSSNSGDGTSGSQNSDGSGSSETK